MALIGEKSIVLRGSANADPTAVGYVDKEIGIYGIFPDTENEAEEQLYGGGLVERGLKERYVFTVFCRPFKVRAQGDTSEYQDYGDLADLKAVCRMPYVWLWRAYGALSTGVLPRTATGGEETFWNLTTDTPAGILPIQIVRPDINPEPNHPDGVDDLTFKIKARERIS